MSNCLGLVDLYNHARGGHFGHWLVWFANEFSLRFDCVVIITPSPALTRRLFADSEERVPRNIIFSSLLHSGGKRLDLGELAEKIHTRTHIPISHFFFMWGYDLKNFSIYNTSQIPWATLIGISRLHRSQSEADKARERYLSNLIEDDSSCKAFFQPDFYLQNRQRKAVFVPDIEKVELSRKNTKLASKISEFKQDCLCVGAFGMLTGARCVEEMVKLAKVQPDIRFVLVGKLMTSTVQQDILADLLGGTIANLMISPHFVKTDAELNSAISSVDAVFIDSRNYPVQSGIVLKALHFGKWILSSSGNSWTNDLIAQEGIGFTYDDRSIDIIALWRYWKDRNGEEIARKYSEKIRDKKLVAACFDEITRRLDRE